MSAGDRRLGHRLAHLVLLGSVLTRHLGGDLVVPGSNVVARVAGVRPRPARSADEIEVVEILAQALNTPITPASGDA